MSDNAPNPTKSPSAVADQTEALRLDNADPLTKLRDRFHIPNACDGAPCLYFAGNSLGLQPRTAKALLDEELDDWASLGVDGHFEGRRPWYSYHERLRNSGARLVGAIPGEVVVMNSLTVNLQLLLVSFYRPTTSRFRILMEDPEFPSDTYAVKTHLKFRGFDPAESLVVIRPRPGEHTLRHEDIETAIAREGDRLALVLMSGVNFVTGQLFDMARITESAHRVGTLTGFDLAHAAGNVPIRLHDWNVDFAVWCNYKYLNSGPGAVGGCFVHERHGNDTSIPRLAGWWGNDPATRFRMQLEPEFIPKPGADGWQVSNPPIFSLAPVLASYDIFHEVGMDALREKSIKLTGYLETLLIRIGSKRFEIITPRDPAQRGCQLSLLVHQGAKELLAALHKNGVICDFREPNVIRVAPVPLYNSFHDVWRFAQILSQLV